ncbi:O-antigen ligase family protein [Patescibacteria group bacterium]|nr:O-antigen ligase family protein [Patescibacteria group bacterium]
MLLNPRVNLLQALFFLLLIFLPTQLGKHFWPDFSFVYGIRSDYLSPTLYFTDVIIFAIIFFYIFTNGKKFINFKTILFISPFALGIIVASNIYAFFYGFLKLLEYVFLGLIVAKKIKLGHKAFSIFSFTVLFESILAIAQFFNHGSFGSFLYFLGERNFTSLTPGVANASINGQLVLRPYATFSHPNVLAGFLVLGMIVILVAISKTNRKSIKGYYVLTLMIGSIALFITLSRTAFFLWIVILLIEFFLKIKKRFKLLIGLLFILIFLILLIPFIPFSSRYIFSQFSQESFIQRYDLALSASQTFLNHPLLGVGLNNYLYYIPSFLNNKILLVQPPHNIYLLILVQSGILGFFVFVKFLLNTFTQITKSLNDKRFYYYLFFSVLFLGFLDHYLITLQQGQIILTLVFAFCWARR